MTFREARNCIYDYHKKYYGYLFKWPWHAYRKYKAIFYAELASVILFFALKTNITPNIITIIYIVLNILAGVLLALPVKGAIVTAVLLLFTKSVLDWVDGALARNKKITSISGDILDSYAASVAWVALWAGMGIYLGNSTSPIFYILAPVIPAILAADIYQNATERFVHHYFNKKEFRTRREVNGRANQPNEIRGSRINTLKTYINKFFEYNTRTVDLICLLIFIELFIHVRVLWIFYSAFLIWQLLRFATRIYIIAFKGKMEEEFEELRKKLYE